MRVDPFYKAGAAAQLNLMTAQENTLTTQLSTGLRVASASDDPAAAAKSVKLGSAIARTDAFVQAATSTQSRLQAADSALGSVVSQVTSAISVAVQGSAGTLSAADMKSVAQELAGIRDQVVSLANSSYSGSYLFAGTSVTEPFSTDTSTTPATTSYAGDDQQQYTVTPGGQKLATSLSGASIFSASGADVLGSLNRLISDFSSGSVSANTTADMNELRSGLSNVSEKRATLASSLNALEQSSSYAATEKTNMLAAQTTLVQSDAAAVATGLSTLETQQKAYLSAVAAIGTTNLFDYLK